MSQPSVALAIDVDPASLPVTEAELEALIARAAGLSGFEGELSVAVVDDATMRRVNRDFHATDAATDVLAFPLRDEGDPGGFAAEVVVSLETAIREAGERKVAPVAELLLYVVHGTLHLLGFDDHEPEEARRMHVRTLAILEELGLANHIDLERLGCEGPTGCEE